MKDTVGQYRILALLGEGGMGAVYAAEDTLLDFKVALKSLKSELTSQPELVERFRDEARIQVKLNSPHIVKLYTFMRDGSDYYMVMEYVEGRTLGNIVEVLGRFQYRDAIHLLLQVLEGLEHAHGKGVIHRDIKLNNVMVTPDGTVKVMDFGIARVLGSRRLTRAGNIVGTLDYICPEALNGLEITPAADVYSCGVMLYKMVTGSLPFISDNDYLLARMHVEVAPPPPTKHIPDLPRKLEEIILRALAKSPTARFDTAAQMADALEQFLEEDKAAQRPGAGDGSFWRRLVHTRPPAGRGDSGPGGAAAPQRPGAMAAAAATANRRIEELMAQNRLREAMDMVQDSLRAYPDDTTLRDLRGRIEREQRHYEEGLRRSAQEIRGYLDRGLTEMALSAAETSLARYSGEASLLELLLQAKQQIGEKQQIAKIASKIEEEIRPLVQEGRYTEAISVVIEAVSLHPEQPELSALLSRTIKAQRDHEKRKMVLECRTEAEKLWKEGRYDQAVARVEQTRLAQPDDPSLLTLLRQLLEARDEAKKRSDLDRVSRKVDELEASDRLEEADTALEIALRRFPRNQELLARRADIATKIQTRRREAGIEYVRSTVDLLRASADWKKAHAELDLAVKRLGSDPQLDALRTELEAAHEAHLARLRAAVEGTREQVRSEHFEEALGALPSHRRDFPDEPEFGRLAAEAQRGLELQQKRARLRSLIEKAAKLIGDDAPDEAHALLQQAAPQFRDEPDLAAALQSAAEAQRTKARKLAVAEAMRGAAACGETADWARGAKLLREALQKHPRVPELEEKLQDFEAKALAKRRTEARLAAEESCRRDVAQLVEQGRWDQALAKIDSVLREFPDGSAMPPFREEIASRWQMALVQQSVEKITGLLDAGRLEDAARQLESDWEQHPEADDFLIVSIRLDKLREEAHSRKERAGAADRATALIAIHSWAEAEEVIVVAEKRYGSDARLAQARQSLETSRNTYRARVAECNSEVDRLAGSENWTGAVAAAERLLGEYPEPVEIRQLLDRTHERFNAWRKAKELEQAIAAGLAASNKLASQRLWKESLAELDRVEASCGSSADLKSARKSVLEARKQHQDAVAAACKEAQSLLSQRNWDDALRVLARQEFDGEAEVERLRERTRKEQAEELRKQQLNAALDAIRHAIDQGSWTLAARRIEAAEGQFPAEKGIAKLRLALTEAQEKEEREVMVASALAEAARQPELDLAIGILEEAIQESGEDARILEAMARLKQSQADRDMAAREIDGLMAAGKTAEARAVAQNAVQRFPLFIDGLRRIEAALGLEDRIRQLLDRLLFDEAERVRGEGAGFAGVAALGAEIARRRDAYQRSCDEYAAKVRGLIREGKFDQAQNALQEGAGLPPAASLQDELAKAREAGAVRKVDELMSAGKTAEAKSAAQKALQQFPALPALAEALSRIDVALGLEARIRQLLDALHFEEAERLRIVEGASFAGVAALGPEIERRRAAYQSSCDEFAAKVRALIYAGKFDRAQNALQEGAELPPAQSLRDELAKAREAGAVRKVDELMAAGKTAEAKAAGQEALQQFPGAPALAEALGRIDAALGLGARIRQLLDALQFEEAERVRAEGASFAEVAAMGPEIERRRAEYQRACDEFVNRFRTLVREGKLDQAQDVLVQGAGLPPASVLRDELAQAREADAIRKAGELFTAGRTAEAKSAAQKALQQFPKSPALAGALREIDTALGLEARIFELLEDTQFEEAERVRQEGASYAGVAALGPRIAQQREAVLDAVRRIDQLMAAGKTADAEAAAKQALQQFPGASGLTSALHRIDTALGLETRVRQLLDELQFDEAERVRQEGATFAGVAALGAEIQQRRAGYQRTCDDFASKVRSLIRAGKFDQAQTALQDGAGFPPAPLLQAELTQARKDDAVRKVDELMSAGKTGEAKTAAQIALQQFPGLPALTEALGRAEAGLGLEARIRHLLDAFQFEEAERVRVAEGPGFAGVAALAAEIKQRREAYQQSCDEFASRVRGLIREGKFDQAEKALQQEGAGFPPAPLLHDELAHAREDDAVRKVDELISAGKTAEAKSAAQKALQQFPALPALAEALSRIEAALSEQQREAYQRSCEEFEMKVRALMRDGKFDEAESTLLDGVEFPAAALLIEELEQARVLDAARTVDELMAAGKTAEAKSATQKALQQFPAAPALIEALSSIETALSLESRIRQLLDASQFEEAEQAHAEGTSFAGVAALGPEITQRREAHQRSCDELQTKVRKLIRAGKFEQAHIALQDGAGLPPAPSLGVELAQAREAAAVRKVGELMAAGRFAEADAVAQKALQEFPEAPALVEALARIEAALAEQRREAYQRSCDEFELKVRTLIREAKFEQAESALLEGAEFPPAPSLQAELAKAREAAVIRTVDELVAAGKTAEAKSAAQMALQQFPAAPALVEALARIEAALADQFELKVRTLILEAKFEQAESALLEGAEFPPASSLQAELAKAREAAAIRNVGELVAAGKTAEAKSAAQKALQQFPDAPALSEALARIETALANEFELKVRTLIFEAKFEQAENALLEGVEFPAAAALLDELEQAREAGAVQQLDELLAAGKTTESHASAQQALQRFPGSPAIVEALSRIDAARSFEARIRELLDASQFEEAERVRVVEGANFGGSAAALGTEIALRCESYQRTCDEFETKVRTLIREGRFEQAESVLRDGPGYPEAPALRTELASQRLADYGKKIEHAWAAGDFKAADAIIQNAIRTDSEAPAVFDWLQEHERRSSEWERQRKLDRLKSDFKRAINANSLDHCRELVERIARDHPGEPCIEEFNRDIAAQQELSSQVAQALQSAEDRLTQQQWDEALAALPNPPANPALAESVSKMRQRIQAARAAAERGDSGGTATYDRAMMAQMSQLEAPAEQPIFPPQPPEVVRPNYTRYAIIGAVLAVVSAGIWFATRGGSDAAGGFTVDPPALAFQGAGVQKVRINAPAPLDYVAVSEQAWVHLTEADGKAPGTLTVEARPGRMAPGKYRATIKIHEKSKAANAKQIGIELTVLERSKVQPPVLDVSPRRLSVTHQVSQPMPGVQRLAIRGVPADQCKVRVTKGADWLIASIGPGAAVTVSFRLQGKTAGSYDGEIEIAVEGGAAMRIPVNLTINAFRL